MRMLTRKEGAAAQDVERYLTLHAVGVDSSVSMESVSISLSISTANGGLERYRSLKTP